MKTRGSRVRTKVTALLVSLVALWGFAAFVTLREGLNLLSVARLADSVGRPTEVLVSAVQQERRLSVMVLGGAAAENRPALTAQRTRTDEARQRFTELARSSSAQDSATGALKQRIDEMFNQLDGLSRTRDAINAGIVDRGHAAAAFTGIIDAGFRIYGSMSALDDQDVAKESRTIIALSRAREVLSQEDALLAGVLAAGKVTAAEHAQFVGLAGTQRFLYNEAQAELPAAERAKYAELAGGSIAVHFRILEDRVIDNGRPGAAVPVEAADWKNTVDPLFAELRDLELSAADKAIEGAKGPATGVIVRLLLAGGLGLLAVIASFVISITTARALIRQLEKLRAAALELAGERLPRVVERLRRGEEVDMAAEAPPLDFGSGEIGQVGQAFNRVQQTAVEVAVSQAALRKGVRDVFLNLARRTQTLVHRQLRVLDTMERRETKPEELTDLFRVDHLATRMRRNAENLIVLSGAVPGRGWRNPVPLVDVVRGAVAEVEEYDRVKVVAIGPAALVGRAVGDVIHLLAELIENAASFSPPDTFVQVSGQRVANGFAVEIEDRGLGMNPADLQTANEQLRNPPEFNLTSTARLGLYVVGRLAERQGIRVQLRESPYGGTTAIVLIPSVLMAEQRDGDRQQPGRPTGAGSSDLGAPGTAGLPRVEPAGDGAAGPAGEIAASAGSRAALTRLVPRRRARLPDGEPAPEVEREEATMGEPVAMLPDPRPGPDRRAERDRGAERDGGPEPVSGPPVDVPTEVTPAGLPRRVRQANLAAPLRDEPPPGTDTADDRPAVRPPEETRRMMSSYQRHTRLGRVEALRSQAASQPNGPTPPPGYPAPSANTAPAGNTAPAEHTPPPGYPAPPDHTVPPAYTAPAEHTVPPGGYVAPPPRHQVPAADRETAPDDGGEPAPENGAEPAGSWAGSNGDRPGAAWPFGEDEPSGEVRTGQPPGQQ